MDPSTYGLSNLLTPFRANLSTYGLNNEPILEGLVNLEASLRMDLFTYGLSNLMTSFYLST